MKVMVLDSVTGTGTNPLLRVKEEQSGNARISVGGTVRVRVGEASDVEGDGSENRRNGDHQETLLHHAEVVLQEEERDGHGHDGEVHEDVTQRVRLHGLQEGTGAILMLENSQPATPT